MRTTWKFYAWSSSGGAGDEWAWINVDWNYEQNNRKINITGISYGGDRYGNPGYWYVGSSMRMSIAWSDGGVTDLANGTYNVCGGSAYYCSTAVGAGFIDKGSVHGIFGDSARACTVSHTFSGTSGGFTVKFGSTASTINAGNPQSWRELERTSGDVPSVQFSSPPVINANNIAISSSGVWKLSSSVSGIDWGLGASYKTLTATVSYDFNGTHYSYNAGTWTDGRTSASISINSYSDSQPWVKVPAGANATVTWKAETNIGTSSQSKSVFCKAPDQPTIGNITTSNPDVYYISSTVSNIYWGDYKKSADLYCVLTGSIDGNTISYTSPHYTDAPTSKTFSLNAKGTTDPWLKVPDDENETVTWYAKIDVGYTTFTTVISKDQYCMKSYNAYVIQEGVNGGSPVEADLIVSNTVGSQPNKEIRRIATIDG